MAARFSACTVKGELSTFTRAASGHCYFTVKDSDGATASLRCAMFRRAAGLLAFNPREGQQVELRGRIAVYEQRGELQFVVEAMRETGEGALYERFLRLKRALGAEGLFDAERKRPLPIFVRHVVVVTSLGAAALHDVITTLARRAAHVRVTVVPTLVQGVEAPAQIVAALQRAQALDGVDAVLLCRGGGSLEDLWAFNDERVVRAVAACELPLISGVGHETDVTLVDFAADLRAPTPTAAAEVLCASRDEWVSELSTLAQRLHRRMHHRMETLAQALDRRALLLAKPTQGVARHLPRLDNLRQRLSHAVARDHLAARTRTEAFGLRLRQAARTDLAQREYRQQVLAHHLRALDPRQVLARGYAWVSDAQGKAIVSVSALSPGQTVRATWADGQADARIDLITPGPSKP